MRAHGKDVRVYLGGRDASGDLMSIDPSATRDTHDATTFGTAAGWKRFDSGLYGWEAQLEAFYDPALGGIGRQLESIGVDTAGLGVLSLFDGGAAAVGDAGFLGSEAILTKRSTPIKVADLVKLAATLQGDGRAGLHGRLLHALAARTTAGQGASLDNGASSANGGRGNLHVTAATGAGVVKIQHSADGLSWSDLITFAAASALGAQSIEVSGTVEQFTRVDYAPGTSLTFACGFARY